MRHLVLTIAIAFATLLTSCNFREIVLVGVERNVVVQLKPFDNLVVRNATKLSVEYGDTFEYMFHADAAYLEYLTVEQDGLTLMFDSEYTFDELVLRVPRDYNFRTLKVNESGASNLFFKSIPSEVETLELGISGAGCLMIAETDSMELLDIKISGASKAEIDNTYCEKVNCLASGASKLNLFDGEIKSAGICLSGASETTIVSGVDNVKFDIRILAMHFKH